MAFASFSALQPLWLVLFPLCITIFSWLMSTLWIKRHEYQCTQLIKGESYIILIIFRANGTIDHWTSMESPKRSGRSTHVSKMYIHRPQCMAYNTTHRTTPYHNNNHPIDRPTDKSTMKWNASNCQRKLKRSLYVHCTSHNICIECLQYTKAICDFYLLLITLHVHNRSKMELIMKKALIRRSNELWNRCIYVNFEWLSVDFVNA